MQATIELNGVRIFYDVAGDGPPVLLIMGLGTPHVGWQGQLAPFRARYRAIAHDNRGCGRSGTPPGPFQIRDMAEDAAALLGALRVKRAHVVGISLGGMVAQELALGWPDRIGALVLASTYAAPPDSVRKLADGGAKVARDPFSAMKRIVELTFSAEFMAREGAAIMGLFARGSPDGLNVPGLMAQAAATLEHDTRARIGRLKAPVLVLTGDKDAFIDPKASDELARLIPGSRLERIAGGTHGMNLERAAEWNEVVLGFLREHDALVG